VPNETFGWGKIDLGRAMNGPGQFLGRFTATGRPALQPRAAFTCTQVACSAPSSTWRWRSAASEMSFARRAIRPSSPAPTRAG
jgi:hypothetical protein